MGTLMQGDSLPRTVVTVGPVAQMDEHRPSKPSDAGPSPARPAKSKRGLCSQCGKEYALNNDGMVREHDQPENGDPYDPHRLKEGCPGSREPPRED